MSLNYRSYLDFLTETAFLAGRITLAHFQTGVKAESKADNTPVTLADRQSEEFIRRRIESSYPGSAIVGEEFGAHGSTSASMRFIIDPIDGTKAFTRGVPLYAVLLGLEIEGAIVAGAAYFPGLDEMLCAANGEGCFLNSRRAHVSPVTDLSKAYLLTTDWGGFHKANKAKRVEQLINSVFYRGGWSDAYAFNLVATNRAEIAIEPRMEIWDCGPFPVILQEAGGYFGDWQGKTTIYGGEAVACSQELLPIVLNSLNPND